MSDEKRVQAKMIDVSVALMKRADEHSKACNTMYDRALMILGWAGLSDEEAAQVWAWPDRFRAEA